MPSELDFSQFYEDFAFLCEALTADVKEAIPMIPANGVFLDRYFVESPLGTYAVIVPDGLTMRGNEDGVASIPQVEQQYGFTIYIRRKLKPSDNVVLLKAQDLNNLTKRLMASIRYKDIYERPFVGSVDMSEAEPNPKYYVGSLSFVTRCANWRHAAL